MKNLWISETWVNRTENCGIGESGNYETFTNNRGELFKFLQKENGKCISCQYVDGKDGAAIQTGWVLQKTSQYEDTGENYIQETWITVYKSELIKHVSFV